MRWRRGIQVLERRRGEVQIGTDPRWAIRLGGLARREVELLRALSDITDVPLEQLAHRHSVPLERSRELVAALDGARVVAPDVENRRGLGRTPVPARLGEDLRVLSLLADDADGAELLRTRGASTVRVEGLGRAGAVLAGALATAGVGTIGLADPRPVSPAEPGVAGLTERDVGTPREEVVARVLTDVAPGVSTAISNAAGIDVVVLVDSYANDPQRADEWRSRGVTVLPLVVREGDVVVGPLVRPDRGPCLRCVGLHLSDTDRDWPLLWAQLCARGQREPAPQESVLAQLAGTFAAGQVLAEIDGTGPATLGASFELAAPELVGRRREWAVHPRCECSAPPPAGPRRAGGEPRYAGASAARSPDGVSPVCEG